MLRKLISKVRLRVEELVDSILWRNFSLFGTK